MGSRSPTTIGFVGGLLVGIALSFFVSSRGGGLTPLLVVPLCAAFFGGAIGMFVPTRRR